MQVRLVEATGGKKCPCVGKHVPLPTVLHRHHIVPLGMGGPDIPENEIDICPNAHYNIHDLLYEYRRYKGTPPGSVRKHYSDWVQKYAKLGWDGAVRKGFQVDQPLSGIDLDHHVVRDCPK